MSLVLRRFHVSPAPCFHPRPSRRPRASGPTRLAAVFLITFLGPALALAAEVPWPGFDFTQPAAASGWQQTHDLGPLQTSSTGLVLNITGADPYLMGPARDFPPNAAVWARLRLYSEQPGSCQLFYYRTSPTEAQSVRFEVPAGQWVEGRLPLPPLGSAYRVRIDPPGTGGRATLGWLRFEPRSVLPDFDLTTVPDATLWTPQHDLASLRPSPEGLLAQIDGGDPYFSGPPRNYPSGTPLWLHVRLKSDQGGVAQIFYYTSAPTEENSVRFPVPAGVWYDTKVRIPPLGPGHRLRIDPPGTGGACVLARLRFEERILLEAPVWPTPQPPLLAPDAVMLRSGDLTLRHAPDRWGTFALEVAGEPMAVGFDQPWAGYLAGTNLHWLALSNATTSVSASATNQVRVTATLRDAHGALWRFEQTFASAASPGTLAVETRVAIDQPRTIAFLPMLTVFPGLGSFGTNKTQALLAGVEYLDNEPSSSEADLEGPAAQRQVPDVDKLCFPLMAIAARQRYLGLVWEPGPQFAAVFDSPDRLFRSGGHLLGLIFPGSDGLNREEYSLIPYDPALRPAGDALILRAQLVGGHGDSIVSAVQHYARLHPLPPVPAPGYTPLEYFRLTAHGWLDSQIRDGARYRHAYGAGFTPMPAADAAFYLEWLAPRVQDPVLAERLTAAATAALAQVPRASFNAAQVGHVRYPHLALHFAAAAENAAQAQAQGRSLLGRFDADGSVRYRAPAGGLDYARTHWATDANGLTAGVLVSLLEAASFSGDPQLLAEGLRLTRALDRYRHTVPRGAQTWEIALHAPDILASAYLVYAYTRAYELSGDPALLETAVHWAWTGVPFVYLAPANPQPVGLYATTPVLAATAWKAPVWIGLPVQWCGLVYADAIARLAPYDPEGPWTGLAHGIAASGVQQTYPLHHPTSAGLLPDSYNLRAQSRNPADINPATLQANALRLFGQPALYTFHPFRQHGLLVHAPCELTVRSATATGVAFSLAGDPLRPYAVLINGVWKTPRLRLNDRDVALAAPHQYDAAQGRLVLQLTGPITVALTYPALAALTIERDPDPLRVRVGWPATAATHTLETAPALGGAAAWRAWTDPIASHPGGRSVLDALTEPARFYRLRALP